MALNIEDVSKLMIAPPPGRIYSGAHDSQLQTQTQHVINVRLMKPPSAPVSKQGKWCGFSQ